MSRRRRAECARSGYSGIALSTRKFDPSDPQVSPPQSVRPVACVGGFDQRVEHIERHALDPIAEA
jgi:hypothetical protein